MTFSYDLEEDRGKVRLLISDNDSDDYIFEDEELDVFLGIEGAVLLSAARALEVIAANEVMVQKRIQILDLRTDGPAEADALLKIAEKMRASFDELESDDAGFEIANFRGDVFSDEQMRWNEIVERFVGA